MTSRFKHLVYLIAAMALSACGLSSCGGANAVKSANEATADNKPETIAFALYADFVVIEELAADVKENVNTPESVRQALKTADALASPVAESLHDAAQAVNQTRAAIASGSGGAANLPAMLANLNQLITDSAPKLKAFTDAFKAAREATKATPAPTTYLFKHSEVYA